MEVVPNSRVVFTWGWDGEDRAVKAGSSRVEIDLTLENNGTRIRPVPRALPPEPREKHDYGWTHFLTRLKTVSEGGDPGRDPFADPNIRHG